MSDEARSHTAQVIGSLLVAVLIVALTIALVTAKLGPGGGEDGRSGDRREDHGGRH